MVHDIFNLRSCSYDLTEENILKEKFKTCLEFHLNRCNAPCVSNIQKFSYLKIVSEMKDVFSFQFDKVRNSLRRYMKQYSEQMEFEKAQDIKNRMSVVDDLQNKMETFRVRRYNNIAREFKESLGLLNVPSLIEAFETLTLLVIVRCLLLFVTRMVKLINQTIVSSILKLLRVLMTMRHSLRY